MTEKPTSHAVRDFLGEAEEIIEKLNLDLVTLGDCADSGEVAPELLNSIFRGAHSVKGLSGMFGFDDISELSHHAENLLDSLRLGKIPLNGILVEVLFDTLEALTRLVHGKGEAEDFTFELGPLIERINSVLNGGERNQVGLFSELHIDAAILNVLTEFEEHRLLENIKQGRNLLRIKASFSLASFDQDLAEITDLLKRHGEVISTLPCPGDLTDRIAFQLLFGTSLDAVKVSELLQRDDITIEFLGRRTESAQTDAPAKESTNPAAATETGDSTGSIRSISRMVRVDIDKLDSLMNIVGELVLSKSAITTVCDRLKKGGAREMAAELQKAIRILERRLDELQKGVMEVRMVPVGQLFEKMVRIIRRVANEQGKKVSIDIRGAETELDKLIIEDLSDPLMHIIRNAIDHGIESAHDRVNAGKPEKGAICLWASQKGNHVLIEVRDDGRGIDPEMVRRKAVQKGLIASGAELSREEVYDLVFTPGFSTRDDVSDLSGRGVGMDVVANNIAALSGMIEIDSEVGAGTAISITLPITLAIIKALIVQVCGRTYAVPINAILETLMIEPSSIRTIERKEVIELRQSTLPLLRLGEMFDLPESSVRTGRPFVVVVGLADKKIGLIVDDLLGQQDVVIKSLGSALSFVKGIAGAADLGNQKTILVLDIGGLISEALRGESAAYV